MSDQPAADTSSRIRQGILWGLGAMLVLVPLYFSPSMSDYHTPKFILVQVFATTLGCLLLISMVLDGEVYILDHPIYYTILAFLAANFGSLFQAANIFQGLYSVWIQICYFLVAILCFHCIRDRRQVRSLVGVMVAAGGAVALIGLIQHNAIFHFYHKWNIAASTIGNVNFVAEYYNVVYPVSLVMLLIVRRPILWSLLLLACFAMTCHLIVMGSRGGWLGVVIAGVVIGGAEVVRRFQIRRRAIDGLVAGLLCVLLAWPVMAGVASSIPLANGSTLTGLGETYWDVVVSRSTDAMAVRDRSTKQRILLWWDTLGLIGDRPLLGVGTGNYAYNIQKHLSQESLTLKQEMESETGSEHLIFRAHNDYLQVWSEAGLVGILLFLVLLIQIMRAVGSLILRYIRGEEDPLVVGLGAAVLATLAHALFSSNFQNPASATVFWVVVGFVWTYSVEPEDRTRLGLLNTRSDGFSFGVMAVGVVVVVFTVYHGLRMWQGAIYFQSARTLVIRGEKEQALETLEASLRYPSPSPFATYEMIGRVAHRLGRFPESQAAMERSLAFHPNNPGANYYLGRSLVEQGKREAALAYVERAVELEPFRPEYRTTFAIVLGQVGRTDEAVSQVREALSLDPNSKEAYYALGGIEQARNRNQAALDAFDRALELGPTNLETRNSRARQLVMLERFDEAVGEFEAIVAADPEMVSARLNLAVAEFSRGDAVRALEAAYALLRESPSHAPARAFAAYVHESTGRTDLAAKVKAGELP